MRIKHKRANKVKNFDDLLSFVKSTMQKRLNLPTELGNQHVLMLKVRCVRSLKALIKP